MRSLEKLRKNSMTKIKKTILAHKIVTGIAVFTLILTVGVVAAAYTSQNEAPNTVFEGDCVGCDLSKSVGAINEAEEINLGAAGPDHHFRNTFYEGFTKGGDITDASSTLYIALTLTTKQVCDSQVIHVNASSTAYGGILSQEASLDITFPATSTMFASCLRNNGDSIDLMFYNDSPTAATTTQIVAGTGGYLWEPDGQNVEIGGGNAAHIRIQRMDAFRSNEDYMLIVDELIAG